MEHIMNTPHVARRMRYFTVLLLLAAAVRAAGFLLFWIEGDST
jgi:hypothetical protein